MPDSPLAPGTGEVAQFQRRTVAVLSLGQVLGGLAFGATLSLGAVLAAELSGDEAFSGLAAAAVTFGTALTAVPLAAIARRRGRRLSLTTGMAVALIGVGLVIGAVAADAFPLLLAGFLIIGAGQAANLQSRFAAADLATDASRGRDLSIVVWATKEVMAPSSAWIHRTSPSRASPGGCAGKAECRRRAARPVEVRQRRPARPDGGAQQARGRWTQSMGASRGSDIRSG